MRQPAAPPRRRRSTTTAVPSVAQVDVLLSADPAEADRAANTAESCLSGDSRSRRVMRRGNTVANSTTVRCRPGRRTADKADVFVGFPRSHLELNGCARTDVDRSCPPHALQGTCSRTPPAETCAEQPRPGLAVRLSECR